MDARNRGYVKAAAFPEVWNPEVKGRGVGRVRLTGRYGEKNRYEEAIRKLVEEFREEQLLDELEQAEVRRTKEEEEGYSKVVAGTKEKVEETKEEAEWSKEVDVGSAEILFDVTLLRDEGVGLVEASEVLESVAGELEEGKRELALVKEEGMQLLSSMNVIRSELVSVAEERARMRETKGEADTMARYLNSELVKEKQKLEYAAAAAEKAKRVVSNLTVELELQKNKAEAAKKETQVLNEGIAAIRTVIDTMDGEIDSAEERLRTAMVELKSVQATEATALGQLEALIDCVSRERASMCQNRGWITISTYEYNYLRERAAGVEEVADKKVAAAMAWAKALEASKNEIVIRSEMARREVWEQRVEEEQHVYSMEMALSAKRRAETELMNQRSLSRRVESEPMNRRSVSVKRRVKYKLKNRKPKIEEDSEADNAQPALPEAPAGTFCKLQKKKKAILNLLEILNGGRTAKQVF